MDVVDLLERDRDRLVGTATETVRAARLAHYEAQGPDVLRRRVEDLYRLLASCVRRNDAGPMIEHARRVASERFGAGFDLHEVQTAFNAIEEAVWTRILAEMEPADLARALGLVSTVLGLGKDALARAYVSLATHAYAPSLDMKALFEGTEGE